MDAPIFADRSDAGRRLVAPLAHFKAEDPLLLALPRGGVPVAHEIAAALRLELDVLIVRKIGAPGHEEYGLGAVVDGAPPQVVLNEEAAEELRLPKARLEAEIERLSSEIARRRRIYRGDRAPPPLVGRTVIVVDDGVATGGTMRAALRAVRLGGAARVALAAPVASVDARAALERRADDLVCLATPEPFRSVGAHYRRFPQTTDDEVVALLERTPRVSTPPFVQRSPASTGSTRR